MFIAELHRYPLKGGAGESLTSTPLLGTGIPHDRRWLLVDDKGRFLSQREHAALALLKVGVGSALDFRWGQESLTVPMGTAAAAVRMVTVWKDTVPAWDLGDQAAAFFSRIMGQDVRLVEARAQGERQADTEFTESQKVDYLFADAFPYLIISQESLDLLNQKLDQGGHPPLGMDRFRPNIVIKGWEAHAEDRIQTIRIGDSVRLRLVKPCSRCNVTTVNQTTGEVGREPLPTLASYRKLGTSKIFFGMNAWVLSGAGGTVKIGDPVVVE